MNNRSARSAISVLALAQARRRPGRRWQSTQDSEDFSDGPEVLIRDGLGAGAAAWTSLDIILVRTSDLPNDQSAAQRQQLGERLFGSANWDTDFTAAPAQSGSVSLTTTDELVTVISTATLANGRIVKFLNHEPFVYFIRVENTTNQPIAVTARIFLVPTNFENDRTAWIEMDKFTATLAASEKTVLASARHRERGDRARPRRRRRQR
jgi:hypothetical protein